MDEMLDAVPMTPRFAGMEGTDEDTEDMDNEEMELTPAERGAAAKATSRCCDL
jgi:hypothetical protein